MLSRSNKWIMMAAAFAAAPAQAQEPPYCVDLQHIVRLAGAPDKFASISGNVRQGSFHETLRPLLSWKDCTIYADKTYACNSDDITTPHRAERQLNNAVAEIHACFGEGWWTVDPVRTSQLYVVLHHPVGLATMTISTDEDRPGVHGVPAPRLTKTSLPSLSKASKK